MFKMRRRHNSTSSFSFILLIKVILLAGRCILAATVHDVKSGHISDLIKIPSITSSEDFSSSSPPATTTTSPTSTTPPQNVTPSTEGTSSGGSDVSPTTLPLTIAEDNSTEPIPLIVEESSLYENVSSSSSVSSNASSIPSSSSSSSSLSESELSSIRKCSQKDSASLNKCLQQVLKDLKPRLAGGIPEINLPPMEPLKLENVAFQQGSGPVTVASEFTSVEVSGLSNFSQSNFWVDVAKRTLDFDLVFPQLSLVGIYELSGNLFVFPIGGNGNFYLNLGGTRAKGAAKLGVFRNATQAQVVVKKTDINLEIESIKVHLSNLFNGDPLLGTVINNFLNENSQEVFEEVKPQIGAQVGEMLSLLANRALSSLSTSHFDEVPFKQDEEEDVLLDTLSKNENSKTGQEEV